MKILLTSPFAHPYVRRGVERYVSELADWLTTAGHDVELLTTAPDRARRELRPSGAVVRYQKAGRPIGSGRLRIDEVLRTAGPLWRGYMRSGTYDVIEAHHYPDGAALRAARWRHPLAYGLWLPGVPRQSSLGRRPLNRAAATYSMRGARRLLALSRHAADAVSDEFGLKAEVLPPGVNTARYAGGKPEPSGIETVLCAAAPEDPRKKVDVLVRAFEIVSKQRPQARLLLAPPRAQTAQELVADLDDEVRQRVTVRVPSDSNELAQMYRHASVSVLPSVDEAFGLVLVESLASGTPVVGTRSGGVPDVIDDEGIGRLAPPMDVDGLARAILETLDLALDPGSAPACRAAALRWDWSIIGARWLELNSP